MANKVFVFCHTTRCSPLSLRIPTHLGSKPMFSCRLVSFIPLPGRPFVPHTCRSINESRLSRTLFSAIYSTKQTPLLLVFKYSLYKYTIKRLEWVITFLIMCLILIGYLKRELPMWTYKNKDYICTSEHTNYNNMYKKNTNAIKNKLWKVLFTKKLHCENFQI